MDTRTMWAIILAVAVMIIFHYLYTEYFFTYPPSNATQTTPSTPDTKLSKEKGVPYHPSLVEEEREAKIFKNWVIETDKYRAELTSVGARFKSFQLKNYVKDKKERAFVELVSVPSESLPLEVYLAKNPSLAILNFAGPKESNFLLKEDSQALTFTSGVPELKLEKTYIFKKDSYFIDFILKIHNPAPNPLEDQLLIRGVFSPFSEGSRYVFRGPFYYTDHLNEVEIKDNLKDYVGPLKYLGYQDVYFTLTLIPEKVEMGIENATYRATFRKIKEDTQEFILWIPLKLHSQETKELIFKIYAGPKKTEEMEKEYPLLSKALYFGFFDIVAKPLLWSLKFFNQFTHNYGWSILIITIFLRILFFPLNHLSFRSMKKLQEIQPIIQKLREKYKGDPQTLNKELMNVYKTHKVNPFSGCLPIIIQIPVFFAFYKVLLMAIELRHAPFILWIDDLSAPERLYLGSLVIPYLGGIPVLTILMGLSMFIQQKLTPTTLDPIQNKILLLMPLFFTVLFVNFPSGLVLYWFANNLLSIAQQLITLKLFKK
ncbi:MAG: membrane protein insertase YidC [Thermodesulfobacteriaceae bacterium]|nr:membrane protein insertase YidC [Thermodesulfobacteriaceae bacterium]